MVEADTSGRAVNLGLYLILLKIAHFGLICQYHPEVPAQRLSEARCLALLCTWAWIKDKMGP
jgi:hypothetical protein